MNQEIQGKSDSDCPGLASPSLVSIHHQPDGRSDAQTTEQTGPPEAGTPDTSQSQHLLSDSLVFEWEELMRKGYSDKVLTTLLTSRRPSTNKIYGRTWEKFSHRCTEQGVSFKHPKRKHILEFLQEGINKGLSTNTINRQLSTISSILGPRRVILRLDPSFMTKVNSVFHRAQEVVLPTLCPNPQSSKERAWHSLDAKRALSFYLDQTREFKKSDALFVLFGGLSRGKKASTASLSWWLRASIVVSYKALGKDPPTGVTAHSTRGAATSAVFEGGISLESICKAAAWASPNTFIWHYKIYQAASAEVAFGRRVLQTVISQS